MKYLKLNLQYLFSYGKGKRFATLFLILLPLSVAAAFAMPTAQFTGWFIEYPGGYRNYLQLVAQMFSGFHWWAMLIFLIVAVATVSVVMSLNNYCLRTGRLSVRYPARLLNDNLIPSFFMVLVAAIVMVLWFALLLLFVFLFHYIKNLILAQVVSILFFLFATFGLSAFFATIVLWLPVMSHNGIRPYKAIGYAVEKIGSVWWKSFFATVPITVMVLAVSVGMWFTGSVAACVAVDIIIYDIVFVYFISLCDIMFFDVEGLPREDMPRGYSARHYH